jgi:hypothetical protein
MNVLFEKDVNSLEAKNMAISLKKIEQEALQLIDLAKKVDIFLQKANLTDH